MKNYIVHHPWHIIEKGYRPEYNEISESLFSIGNGRFGQRGMFEENYSGPSLQGSYIAGIYYPDKTRVGWWKNGYPEYFAKVLNATNWIGIHIEVDGEVLDLHTCEVLRFQRTLDMEKGLLQREVECKLPSGKILHLRSERFCSIAQDQLGVLSYEITPLNFDGNFKIMPYLDADVHNKDANYDEQFWEQFEAVVKDRMAYVQADTKKTQFTSGHAMTYELFVDDQTDDQAPKGLARANKYAGLELNCSLNTDQTARLIKYVAIDSSLNHEKGALQGVCTTAVRNAMETGYQKLREAQVQAWAKKWEWADIKIEGDVAAQQGIRFNIFHLMQTYTGEDERLNIGPKGFTGEKYGGSTYWDTEAYCLPFYLSTADPKVGRQLLIYRHNHLPKAIENAQLLGFDGGAALYPMVTMNGEECHNEWEITFEEIHRNGAIAFAIYDYIRYTGDQAYLKTHGLDVLIGIARFWAQRVHISSRTGQYMMHGVTGPNEYENNVNNNWYTSYIAKWCLKYTIDCIAQIKTEDPKHWESYCEALPFYEYRETGKWKEIIENMYLPEDKEKGIFLQQDHFLDKEIIPASELNPEDRPLNQNWSWDRILRSCYIKQADVLQGLYFFEDDFDLETLRRNFDFYEPLTVHESSLSPCVHAVLAARLDRNEKAYEMYVRTARLDLDDYNNDTEDGLHITSMAGTWLAITKGFGGMRVKESGLSFDPFIPSSWKSLNFRIQYRGHLLQIKVTAEGVHFHHSGSGPLEVEVYGSRCQIEGDVYISAAEKTSGTISG